MTARFSHLELTALQDLLYYTSTKADPTDAELYRLIADKVDEVVMEYGLVCDHPNIHHKTDAEPEQVEVADYCPDCRMDFDCETEGHG